MTAPYGPEALVRVGGFVGADSKQFVSLFCFGSPFTPDQIAADPTFFGFARKKLANGDLILASCGLGTATPSFATYQVTALGPDDNQPDVTVVGGGSMLGPATYRAGLAYPALPAVHAQASAIPAVDTLYLVPMPLTQTFVATGLTFRLVTAGAGSSVKSGIWADSGGRPVGAPLVADNVGQSTAGAAGPITFAFSRSFGAARYWYGQVYTGTLPTLIGLVNTDHTAEALIGRAAVDSAGAVVALSRAHPFANALPTLPDGFAFGEVTNNGVGFAWLEG